MSNQFSLKNFGLMMLAMGFLSTPGTAQAGFEWVAPSALATMPESSSSVIVPPAESVVVPSQAMGRPEVLSPASISPPAQSSSHVMGDSLPAEQPIIIGGDSPVVTSQPSSMPSMMPGDIIVPAPLPSSSLPSASVLPEASLSIVLGFAKNVPLAVALRQILPPGYGFSIDSNVDMGVLVSFQGGKPWRDTLRSALAPAGLALREQGQMVSIGYLAAASAHAASMSSPPLDEPVLPQPSPSPVPATSTVVAHEHFLSLPPSMIEPVRGVPPSSAVVDSSGSMPVATSNVVVEGWEADRGDGLRKVLERWARRAGVELNWMSEYDYPLQASVRFSGTFEDAVRNLLIGFEAAHPQPVAELHSNSKVGETVLVVTTRGNAGE